MIVRASIASAVMVLAACGGGAGQSVPPINVPSVPPLNLPSLTLPSLPPVVLPSLNLPTPVGGQSPACQLVTEAEMASITGEPMSVSASVGSECTWSAADITPTVIIRYDTGETIATAKQVFTQGARDLTVGGSPAYYASAPSTLLFIEKGGRPLVVQAIWSLEGEAEFTTIVRIGELAVPRF